MGTRLLRARRRAPAISGFEGREGNAMSEPRTEVPAPEEGDEHEDDTETETEPGEGSTPDHGSDGGAV